MARNIVDTADRTVSIPIRKFNPKWLFIGLILACIIGGSVGGYFAFINKVTSTTTNQQPFIQPTPVPPVAATPTEPLTPVPVDQPPLFFATHMALILLSGDMPCYGVGYMHTNREVPPPADLLYEFPIYVSIMPRAKPPQAIAAIPDPNLKIGEEWQSTFSPPDYPNHLIKVKLTRVVDAYKYKVTTTFSGDGGETWSASLTYPFNQ